MSWGYRSYRSKFYFSEKEIDFTRESLNYEQFLLQEFFTADLEARKRISNYYYDVYGARALAYLNRKYSEWASGDYHLTDLMKERILSLMPKFLNDTAKYKLGIHEFMTSIKNVINSFKKRQDVTFKSTKYIKRPQELVSIFEIEYQEIQLLTIRNFRFNILTEEERREALEISKYILAIKLQEVFNQVERDINIFLPYMLKFKCANLLASYSIRPFNLKLDITNSVIEDIKIPKFKIKEIEAKSRFKKYSDKYLAYELVTIKKEITKSINSSFLNVNDIALFFAQFEELSNGESEVNMKSTFQGSGGVLSLQVQLKPLKLLKSSIIISLVKATIYIVSIIAFILLIFKLEIVGLLIFAMFIVWMVIFGLVPEEIKNLRLLVKEYNKNKEYGN